MSEHPIVCVAAEVRGLLAGRITVLRRPVNMRDIEFLGGGGKSGEDWNDPDCWGYAIDDGQRWGVLARDRREVFTHGHVSIRSPFGEAGDRLWVRETMKRVDSGLRSEVWVYDADGVPVMLSRDDPRVPAMVSWAHHKDGSTCASTQMPRWASRITRDVVSVRVERLHSITDEDIAREGVTTDSVEALIGRELSAPLRGDARGLRALGWNFINGKRAPWSKNPWTWRAEVKGS